MPRRRVSLHNRTKKDYRVHNRLIFDIGCNSGEDAIFYASRGYSVVAVDADPSIIQRAKAQYADHQFGRAIQFINCAITQKDGDSIDFFLNHDSAKNSVLSSVGGRNGGVKEVVQVKTRTLCGLMDEYGAPYYCKIDIEGYDPVAVHSAAGASELPPYMSAEAECKSDEEKFSEDGIFDSLDALHSLGYTKFKLVDQTTLYVLGAEDFYLRRETMYYKLRRKLEKITGTYTPFYTNKQRISKKYNYPFVYDASGPFGEELEGEWISYEDAKSLYLFHRRAFFQSASNRKYSLWADWHATR